jgi:hypothetical protein
MSERTDFDEMLAVLADARAEVRRTIVATTCYVDRKAAEGDPEAIELSRLIASAFDGLTLSNIAGATFLAEHADPDD